MTTLKSLLNNTTIIDLTRESAEVEDFGEMCIVAEAYLNGAVGSGQYRIEGHAGTTPESVCRQIVEAAEAEGICIDHLYGCGPNALTL